MDTPNHELDDELSCGISEIYDWLCVEVAPDVRPRLHDAFTPEPDLPSAALQAMIQRDWLRPRDDGQLVMTAKGLSELSLRKPNLRGT
jgi:hypothetical protein